MRTRSLLKAKVQPSAGEDVQSSDGEDIQSSKGDRY